jgi:hypothetical protein
MFSYMYYFNSNIQIINHKTYVKSLLSSLIEAGGGIDFFLKLKPIKVINHGTFHRHLALDISYYMKIFRHREDSHDEQQK